MLPVAGKKGKTIDLSSNRIGTQGCEALMKVVQDKQSRIEKLNLCDNGLGDSVISGLLCSFVGDTHLKSINVSQNNLTSNCCESLGKLIKSNYTLKQVYARWVSLPI